jgi:hypothetical protein
MTIIRDYRTMKKTMILFLMLLTNVSFAQQHGVKGRINLKISYNQYPWMGDLKYNNPRYKTQTHAGKIETTYGWQKHIESGVYLGFSLYEHLDFSELEQNIKNGITGVTVSLPNSLKPLFFYGFVTNFQLLPFFINKQHFFLDLYTTCKVGGLYFVEKNNNSYTQKRSKLDYGLYGGIALYPWRKLGFYYEYGYGNYIDSRFGISLKF